MSNVISVAPLLKRQGQSPSYGHGWIMGEAGQRWHPSNDQSELLHGMATAHRKKLLARLAGIFGG
ncbi:phage filamentation protein Fil family protein [Pantoea coffeiphila]|uniref:Protein fil n=1 Tax=Pantoea coffeiphila TaxID=1465635 RepID=A0A2S9IBY7_9GAMM|nr:phage filamentation protein Fil family protein [Pantoea coffeiphila]PRD15303.1 protein fil [Pantoea coffeiphila]